VIARWEQKLDLAQAQEQLRLGPEKMIMPVDSPAEEPLSVTQNDRSTM
jgi:aerobic C4-dicarboxylate transport protein